MKYIFSVFLALYSIACFAENNQTVRFLVQGRVLDVDIESDKIGKGWKALHQSNQNWFLSDTKIILDRSEEEVVDVRTKYKNVSGLLNFKFLKSGAIEFSKVSGDRLDSIQKFTFLKKQYKLEVINPKQKDYSNKVYFSDGKTKTLIYGRDYRSCKYPVIQWAGDIDRDNKPDIIVEFNDDSEKNSSTCVFLSTLAKGDELLKEGGCQFFSG